jgi:choline kinase
MKAIILAAGEGSRLRPHTIDRPKCLVEIGGKSLLESQLEVLRSQGIDDVVLVKGYHAGALDRIPARSYINRDYAHTNMVWTLFSARAELTGEVIITYGDIVYSPQVLRAVLDSPHAISVAIDQDWESYWRARCADPLDDAETLKLGPRGLITEIGQAPTSLADIQGQYIGLTKFTSAGLSVLIEVFDRALQSGDLGGKPPQRAFMTDLLQAIVADGHDVHPVFIRGEWVEVDTPRDLELPITRDRITAIRESVGARGKS